MGRTTNLDLQIDEAEHVGGRGGSQSVSWMIRGHNRWWNERTARVRKWNTTLTRGKL
jgi:hypothetical protein